MLNVNTEGDLWKRKN